MSEPTTTRRTIARGAAWSVPVIAAAVASPAYAASGQCEPDFQIIPGESFKCCDGGPDKNMKVTFRITDVNDCIASGGGNLFVSKLELGNGQAFVDVNVTVTSGGIVTAFFDSIQSCAEKIVVFYQIGTAAAQEFTLSSTNIPSGNDTGDCAT